jgi:hypothetical protein
MAAVTRNGQNAIMLYHFLCISLTPEGLVKVKIDPANSIINGEYDGMSFLRLIIATAQLDTVGTVDMLRSSLGKFESANIENFQLLMTSIHMKKHIGTQPLQSILVD